MKKQLLCGILTLLLINAHAQSIAPSTADSSAKGMLAIKLTPFTLLRNMWFTAHVDYAFHPQFSASLGLSPNFFSQRKCIRKGFHLALSRSRHILF